MEDGREAGYSRGVEPGFDPSSPIGSFAETARRIVLEPAEFFRGVTGGERAWPPIAFAIVCILVSAVFAVLLESLVPVDFGVFGGGFGWRETVPESFGTLALAGMAVGFIVVLVPLFVLLGLYIGAFIYQVLIRLVVGSENAGYWATFKIYAYTSVVELFIWVLVLWVMASLYGYYLVFVAVRETHSVPSVRAAIVAAIPTAIFIVPSVIGMVRAL